MLSDIYDWLEHLSTRIPLLGPGLRWLLVMSRKAFQTMRDLVPGLVRVEGTIGGVPVTIRVAGDPGWTVGWVSRLVEQPRVLPEGRVVSLGRPRALRRLLHDATAAVVQQTTWSLALHRRGYDLVIPRHVSSVVKFGPDWPPEDGWRSNHRHLRGTHMVFRVTQEPAEVKAFYREMYVPTMLARHGDRAAVLAETTVRLYAARGGLLLVSQGSPAAPALGGVVFELRGATAVAAVMGVAGGDAALYRRGVGLAIYFYLLNWARQRGLRAVDLGGNAPVLVSSHLAYKTRWGATMARSRGSVFGAGLLLSREPAQKEAVCRLLGAASFVFDAGRGLEAMVCRRNSADPGLLPRKGLSGLVVLDCSGPGATCSSAGPACAVAELGHCRPARPRRFPTVGREQQ